jgi:ABC-type antimicrobial peptide transport system permease subunit
MILAGIAIALGLPVAYAVAKWMQGMLFEIAAIDPITFAAVPAMVLLTAFAACGVPALRAARANPVESLRVD